MGLTVLFTHLKIILLQCFQFSIFNKINYIQMDLKYPMNGKNSTKWEVANNPTYVKDN